MSDETPNSDYAFTPVPPFGSLDELEKLDLRIGVVSEAFDIPGADKLLRLSVDVGEPQPRTVLAGVKERFSAEQMVGKRIVVATNLAPRKMRGFESHGMLLAAKDDEGNFGLLTVDPPVKAGTEIS